MTFNVAIFKKITAVNNAAMCNQNYSKILYSLNLITHSTLHSFSYNGDIGDENGCVQVLLIVSHVSCTTVIDVPKCPRTRHSMFIMFAVMCYSNYLLIYDGE